jgi:hypothetical protein
MKFLTSLFLLLLIYSCGENETNTNSVVENDPPQAENVEPINDATATDRVENEITPGSKKALLIGSWQDANDAELVITISADKYSTFINGEKNWDNPWSLCDYIDYAPENENDNGKFVLVHLADKSAVFYAQEINKLTESQLDITIVKSSSGSGMTQTFIRI